MNKLILNDIQDLWRWREKINIDDFKEDPMAEDMPLYFPCAVVWHVDYGEHDADNYVCYGFVYVDSDDEGNGTYARYKKDSFYWYKHVIETNGSEI